VKELQRLFSSKVNNIYGAQVNSNHLKIKWGKTWLLNDVLSFLFWSVSQQWRSFLKFLQTIDWEGQENTFAICRNLVTWDISRLFSLQYSDCKRSMNLIFNFPVTTVSCECVVDRWRHSSSGWRRQMRKRQRMTMTELDIGQIH